MIDFLNLRDVNQQRESELVEAARRVIESGWYVLGNELEAFEREFADFCGVPHCVGVGNGFDALQIILQASDIGHGDEVVVPGNTYIATWLSVSKVGATPVPADPKESTANIDPSKVMKALTSRTRAIVPVHLYGQPAEMTALRNAIEGTGILLIEDAAQAHGASHNGRPAGSLGDAAAFSFYPTKNLGALGDGGAITTNSPELASRCRMIRNYGSSRKNVHEVAGVNSRLDEMQAAMLRVKLKYLHADNQRRAVLANRYLSNFAGAKLGLPEIEPGNQSAWHLFVVRHERRDDILEALRAQDIHCAVHYPLCPHLQPAYSHASWPVLPVSEHLQRRVLSLPLSPAHSLAEIDRVSEAVLKTIART